MTESTSTAGRGRVDLRLAVDNDGELYILTKSDGMIRKVIGARPTTTPASAVIAPAPAPPESGTSAPTGTLKNPVASTPESIVAGKRLYETSCAPCHGNQAQGLVNYLRSLRK